MRLLPVAEENNTNPCARQRIWALIEKEKEFGLLPEEKVELDDYLKLEHLPVLAKAKARLAGQHG
jgi:hypothetical protein